MKLKTLPGILLFFVCIYPAWGMKTKKMKTIVLLLGLSLLLNVSVFSQDKISTSLLPTSESVHNIQRYGAISELLVNNAPFIQNAIDNASIKGGVVVIPSGTFYTGTIRLKSNVTLYLSKGSILKGLPTNDAYPFLDLYYFGALDNAGLKALIFAKDAEFIKIEGTGIIDGNGSSSEFANYQYQNSEGKTVWLRTDRPQGILFVNCKQVRLSDVSLRNTAAWGIHLLGSKQIWINGLYLLNLANANNDGIDIDGCEDVIIANCNIDSDDDAICIKTKSCLPVKNVLVNNCILSSKWNAFKIGTETYADVSNISVSDCIIKPSKTKGQFVDEYSGTGVTILSTDGAHVRNIVLKNILIDGYMSPIFIRQGNRARTFCEKESKTVGSISDIQIDGLIARNARNFSSSITGLPYSKMKNITLRNVHLQVIGGLKKGEWLVQVPEPDKLSPMPAMFGGNLPASALYVRHVEGLILDRVSTEILNSDERPAFLFDNVSVKYAFQVYENIKSLKIKKKY